jgi:hypothetical protein
MTTLVLNALWLNLADTGEGLSGASGRDRQTTAEMAGDVETLANGRQRAFAVAGVKVSVTRRMVGISFAQKEKLMTWLGRNVQMRDHRGNKWHGVFYAVSVDEYMRPDLYAATITLLVTTTVEGV